MTKVLFMLSAVVMVVAIVLTYQNAQTLTTMRLDRHKTDQDTKVEKGKLEALATQARAVRDQVNGVKTEVTNEEEKLSLAKNKLRNVEAEAERTQKDVEATNIKIADYKNQLKDLPPDFNLETITENINGIKKTIADNEVQATKVQEQVAAKEADLKKVQGQLNAIVEAIETRKKSFDRNSMTATIVAVNNDWGFVVIDGGQNKGITTDTKLLVTRGQQTIGRLNIVSVDGSKTLANIDQKSMGPGQSIAPGDRVILETLYQ